MPSVPIHIVGVASWPDEGVPAHPIYWPPPGIPTHPIAPGGEAPTHPIAPGGVPGTPSQPIYIPVYPAHPIELPPDAVPPDMTLEPSHPIYIPVYPTHPITYPPAGGYNPPLENLKPEVDPVKKK